MNTPGITRAIWRQLRSFASHILLGAYPYRQVALPGGIVELEVRITNHATRPKTIEAALRVPSGWKILTGKGTTTIPARADGNVRVQAIAPPGPLASRHVLGIAIIADGRAFGELAEAIVDLAAE